MAATALEGCHGVYAKHPRVIESSVDTEVSKKPQRSSLKEV